MVSDYEHKKVNDHNEVGVPPWHSLDKTLSKMIVGNGHLHLFVSCVRITMAQ